MRSVRLCQRLALAARQRLWPCRDNLALSPLQRSCVSHPTRFLAFDTSTEQLTVGVAVGERQWLHQGPGAAQSSATLIPAALDLLAQAGVGLHELDAIVFGRGPGSFTGLRTACAVAQGLAAGAGLPVLPVDTLLAVAEEAAQQIRVAGQRLPSRWSAWLDARMDEVYAQDFERTAAGWQALGPCRLQAPETLQWPAGGVAAGNVFAVYGDRLPPRPAGTQAATALPTAAALLRLAPGLLARGLAVPAHEALPLYVRDKVAQTTEERLAAKAAAKAA
jgi:tRNA threonylcarbamoyladenosine biosynthesis protein TsaB